LSDNRSNDSKFQRIIDASPVPYALNDEQQNITYLNPAFIKTFGYDLNDIPTLDDWWPKAYPDKEYSEWVASTWQKRLETAIKNNQPFEPVELNIQCKDGTKTTVMANAASLSGTFEGNHLVILYDISERKKVEEELDKTLTLLENIVNSTPDMIFVKDKELKTIFCNESFSQACGKSREQLYNNTDIENGWDPELVNGNTEKGIRGFVHDDLDALAGKDVHNPNDPANVGGEIRIFDTHKLPLKTSDNHILGVIGIARDVTEQKKAEEQLRQSQKMDALGKLTGGIAHDFNNMLGIILGYAELLQNRIVDDEKSSNYIEQIHSAGDRAKTLTSKLLSFARTKPTTAKKSRIDHLLFNDRNMLEKTLTSKIKLEISNPKNLWQTFIEEDMFSDSILNLCINSMHAMPSGGDLKIETMNTTLLDKDCQSLDLYPGDYVQITISDNGIGMERSTLDHIFEPFFTTKGELGTGLGMSQVYGFVKQNSGDIKVSSSSNQGTQVTIYLPRYDELVRNLTEQSHSISYDKGAGTETILIVDDQVELRELAEEILVEYGYQVISAESATHALELVENHSVDLLLSDVIMPDMDGYQLATKMREKRPEVKIQLVSGYNDEHFVKNVDPVLKQNQINKPYSLATLVERVRELLDEKI